MENSVAQKTASKMRPITAVKIVLDVLMTTVFILLMDSQAISIAFHEIAGLIIGGVFLIHKLLNWKWIKGVTQQIFGRNVKAETRIRYIVDVLLFISIYLIIITGALISQYVFNGSGGDGWYTLHKTAAYLSIPLIGIHVGLHIKWIQNAFRKMLKIVQESEARKWALRTASLLLAVWGIFSTFTNGFLDKMINTSGNNLALDTRLASLTEVETTTGSDSASASTSSSQDSIGSSGTSGSANSGDTSASVSSAQEATPAVSLEQFMSKLYCTACHKHCPLLSPQCGRGVQQQEQAIAEYEAQYGSSSSTQAVVYSNVSGSYLQVGTAVYPLAGTSGTQVHAVTLAADNTQSVQSAGVTGANTALSIGSQNRWGHSQETDTEDDSDSDDDGKDGVVSEDDISSGVISDSGIGSTSSEEASDGSASIGSTGIVSENEASFAIGTTTVRTSGVWNTVATFAPIMWLFGVVGWVIFLLTGQKKKQLRVSKGVRHSA